METFVCKWIVRVRDGSNSESYIKEISIPVYPFIGMRVSEADWGLTLVAECITWLADSGVIQVESTLRAEGKDSLVEITSQLFGFEWKKT